MKFSRLFLATIALSLVFAVSCEGSSSDPDGTDGDTPNVEDDGTLSVGVDDPFTEWEGTGSASDPYKVYNAAYLKQFASEVDEGEAFDGKYFALMRDIELDDDEEFEPIGTNGYPFSGTFDGCDFTISGLYIGVAADYNALFSYLDGGTIKNLNVEGSISGKDSSAGIVSMAYEGALIDNCSFSGTLDGEYYAAGIVSYLEDSTISNCYNTGTITSSDDYAAGIVAEAYSSSIESCYNDGVIDADTGHTGGIAAVLEDCSVDRCYNKNTVYVSEAGGGIVAELGGDINIITNCYNSGSIIGASGLGGIVGQMTGTPDNSYINCYNSGTISGSTDEKIGGIAGRLTTGDKLKACYNVGKIEVGDANKNSNGGLVGFLYNSYIECCYWVSDVEDSDVTAAFYTNSNSQSATATAVLTENISTIVDALNSYVSTYNTENPNSTQLCSWVYADGVLSLDM